MPPKKVVSSTTPLRIQLSHRRILKFTADEDKFLQEGIDKHGFGQWTAVLRDPEFKFQEGRMADSLKTRKAPGALDPAVFPFPSGCKIHYGHTRYEPKWCKFMKLVIYCTFDVFAITPPFAIPMSFLHPSPCNNMNP